MVEVQSSCIVTDGEVIYIVVHRRIYSYNLETGTFSEFLILPEEINGGAYAMTLTHEYIFIFGGKSQTLSRDVAKVDLIGVSIQH